MAASYAMVPFAPEGGISLCKLTDAHFTSANEYYLGIRTKEDPRVLATLVEDADKFKLMAKSLIQRSLFSGSSSSLSASPRWNSPPRPASPILPRLARREPAHVGARPGGKGTRRPLARPGDLRLQHVGIAIRN